MRDFHGRNRSMIYGVLLALIGISVVGADETERIELSERVDPKRACEIAYDVSIKGKLSTLANGGNSEMSLVSSGQFRCIQRKLESVSPGPAGIRAVRRFSVAQATTTVNGDYRTEVQLPRAHRLLHVFGNENALLHLSPAVRLGRKHVDLLQLPCDPLVASGLLPNRDLEDSTEKWNADPWVVPMLIGLDGVVSQEVTCQTTRVTESEAVIKFEGKAEGAVSGAAVNATLSGQLTFDRTNALIRKFDATLKEERSPGLVSPGLNVAVTVSWSQSVAEDDSDLPATIPTDTPGASRLLLTLATPWQLSLLHDRDWHVFHETGTQLMLRRLQNGALVGQCNIAPARTAAAGKFTDDESFRREIQESQAKRGGQLGESSISTTDGGWRVHHIRSTSQTKPPQDSKLKPESVIWDHYLCSWKTGEQFTLTFTHTKSDAEAFGGASKELIDTLVMRQSQPKLRLPR